MTRFTSLFSALALAAGAAGATVAACGGKPGAPAEVPRVAPPPDLAPAAAPVPQRGGSPTMPGVEARTSAQPGPAVHGSLRMRAVASSIASPEFAPSATVPRDAGDLDSYTPPLPPVPDGRLPDANMQPSLTR